MKSSARITYLARRWARRMLALAVAIALLFFLERVTLTRTAISSLIAPANHVVLAQTHPAASNAEKEPKEKEKTKKTKKDKVSPVEGGAAEGNGVPAIHIIKWPGLQTVYSGEPVTFTILVRNEGIGALVNVVVTDTLTPSCNNNVGTLPVGEQIGYDCRQENVTMGFTNRVVVTGEGEGGVSVSASDSADVVVEVMEVPVLELHKVVQTERTVVQTRDRLTYSIHYSNTGIVDALTVVISETVPGATTFIPTASSPAQFICTSGAVSAGAVCTFDIGTLAAGASGVVDFVVQVDTGLGSVTAISNFAMIDASNAEPASSQIDLPVAPAALPEADQPVDSMPPEIYIHLPWLRGPA